MPLIGFTSYRTQSSGREISALQNSTYVHAIMRAGGTPVMLPVWLEQANLVEICNRLDGIVFTGGGDINPVIYGEKLHPRVNEVDQMRDALEQSLIKMVVEKGIPFLGICRGFQILNVTLGGTLYTNISDQLPGALRHDCYPDLPRDLYSHTVKIEKGSRLANIVTGFEQPVNSLHHQGANKIGAGLKPVAWAPDGLLEAVELPEHKFGIGVQWHPECMPDSQPMQALFREFIQVSSKN